MKVVVLLSGGLDSTTVLAVAKAEADAVVAMHVEYGTKQNVYEATAVENIVAHYNVPLHNAEVRGVFKMTALITGDLPVHRLVEEISEDKYAPSYVPMRNTILLSLAGALAESLDFDTVAYGAHATDGPAYPDTTLTYVSIMRRVLQEGSSKGIKLWAPFISWPKADIIKMAMELDAPLGLTYSCYKGTRVACGACDACIVRRKAFEDAGFEDPIAYMRR